MPGLIYFQSDFVSGESGFYCERLFLEGHLSLHGRTMPQRPIVSIVFNFLDIFSRFFAQEMWCPQIFPMGKARMITRLKDDFLGWQFALLGLQ